MGKISTGTARNFACIGIRSAASVLTILLFLASASSAWAQKNKKNKTDNSNTNDQTLPALALSPSDQIDRDIGEMLGAFQIGDVDSMHKYYSDDATFVSGDYEPPVVGWTNYAALYKREWSAFQGMQLIRKNTYVFTHGDVAWASYQWEFDSTVNNQPYQARGQTTLVFTKSGNNWLIVHNHTSQICQVCPTAQPSQQLDHQQLAPGVPANAPAAPAPKP